MKWKCNFKPEDLVGLSQQVKDLYTEGKNDHQISDELQVHPHAVFQMRKLLGLTLRSADITRAWRRLRYNEKSDAFSMAPFNLSYVENDLKLNSAKCKAYSWKVKEARKLELVLEFKEDFPLKKGKKNGGILNGRE